MELTADQRRLVEAYSNWERRPADINRTVRLEQAARVVADQLGITASQLRIQVASARRRSLPVINAVGQAVDS